MIQITFQRNLIGLEDLLLGTGTVTQTRGLDPVDVTKINAGNFPYDDDYSIGDKIDNLQVQLDTLPAVVDEDGNLLTGLIDTSALDLNLAGRLWRKEIDANTAEIYYGTELILRYDPGNGDLLVPDDYIAADAVVTAAFTAADAVVTAAFTAGDAAVTAAFTAADAALTTAYQADDATLLALINHRASVTQAANVAASSNVTKTIDYADGVWTKITVSSNFTLAFNFTTTEVSSMILEIVNGGAYTITWPAGMKYPNGIKPVLTASGTDHVCVYQDGNNTRYAFVVAADVKVAA